MDGSTEPNRGNVVVDQCLSRPSRKDRYREAPMDDIMGKGSWRRSTRSTARVGAESISCKEKEAGYRGRDIHCRASFTCVSGNISSTSVKESIWRPKSTHIRIDSSSLRLRQSDPLTLRAVLVCHIQKAAVVQCNHSGPLSLRLKDLYLVAPSRSAVGGSDQFGARAVDPVVQL